MCYKVSVRFNTCGCEHFCYVFRCNGSSPCRPNQFDEPFCESEDGSCWNCDPSNAAKAKASLENKKKERERQKAIRQQMREKMLENERREKAARGGSRGSTATASSSRRSHITAPKTMRKTEGNTYGNTQSTSMESLASPPLTSTNLRNRTQQSQTAGSSISRTTRDSPTVRQQPASSTRHVTMSGAVRPTLSSTTPSSPSFSNAPGQFDTEARFQSDTDEALRLSLAEWETTHPPTTTVRDPNYQRAISLSLADIEEKEESEKAEAVRASQNAYDAVPENAEREAEEFQAILDVSKRTAERDMYTRFGLTGAASSTGSSRESSELTQRRSARRSDAGPTIRSSAAVPVTSRSRAGITINRPTSSSSLVQTRQNPETVDRRSSHEWQGHPSGSTTTKGKGKGRAVDTETSKRTSPSAAIGNSSSTISNQTWKPRPKAEDIQNQAQIGTSSAGITRTTRQQAQPTRRSSLSSSVVPRRQGISIPASTTKPESSTTKNAIQSTRRYKPEPSTHRQFAVNEASTEKSTSKPQDTKREATTSSDTAATVEKSDQPEPEDPEDPSYIRRMRLLALENRMKEKEKSEEEGGDKTTKEESDGNDVPNWGFGK